MQLETDVFLVRILVQVIDSIGIERGCAALDAMNEVPLVEQEFGEIRAILSRNARDQRSLLQVSLPVQKLQMREMRAAHQYTHHPVNFARFPTSSPAASAARTESRVCTLGGFVKIQRRMRAPCEMPYQVMAAEPGIWAAPSFNSDRASRLGQILLRKN